MYIYILVDCKTLPSKELCYKLAVTMKRLDI